MKTAPIIGVCFYRWRGRIPYQGISPHGGDHMWPEVQELCRQVRAATGPDLRALFPASKPE